MKTFKRIFVFLVAILATITLVACGKGGNGDEKVTNPVITGYQINYQVDIGAEFDPLAGVNFQDAYDKPDQLKVTTTFKKNWLKTQGTYKYTITAENSKGGKTVSKEITLIVGSASSAIIEGPSLVTYYMGTKPFQPAEEFKAYDVNTGDSYELEVEDNSTYRVTAPGDYEYTLVATDKNGVQSKKAVQLFVKAAVEIPNEIPKNTQETPYKIALWHANGKTIENFINETIKTRFEAAMRQKGIYVQVDIVNNGSNYDELRKNTIQASKTAELPQLIQNYPDHAVEYHSNNMLQSILPYAKHEKWGFDDEAPFTDIVAGYRFENQSVSLEGDYLSLPFNKSTEVVIYNAEAFDDILKGQPFPETWQELFEIADQLVQIKDRHIDRIVQRYQTSGETVDPEPIKAKFVPFAYDSPGNGFITLTRQFGGTYLERTRKTDPVTGKPTKDSIGILSFEKDEGVRTMLEYFASRRNYFTTPQKWEVDYASDPFVKGQTFLTIGSTAGVRYNTPVNKNTKLFKVGVAPMLYDADNPSSRAVIQQGTNISLTKSGTPEQQLLAWLFLKFMISPDIQREFALATGYSPVRDQVYSHPDYLAFLAKADNPIEDNIKDADYEMIIKAMAAKVAAEQRQYSYFDQPFIGSSAIRNAVADAFERILLLPEGANLKEEIEKAITAAAIEARRKADLLDAE